MPDIAFIFLGLLGLFAGGELLVRGASKIAAMLSMSPLMIGLTVVSFGTSAPELAVCLDAVFSGRSEIAVGNIVGSNISNVLLILGLTALIVPLVVVHQLVRLDVPIMVGVSLLFLLLAMDGELGRTDGILLLAIMAAYLALLFWKNRKAKQNVKANRQGELSEEPRHSAQTWVLNVAFVLLGLLLLAAGGKSLVHGAVGVATSLGMSQLVIGLTIVAIGTSMPELVTAVIAAMRGERDIAVGNIVGSNIMNLLFIGGMSSALAPTAVPVPAGAIGFDIPVMIAAAVACLPIFFTGFRIDRWEGGLFLGYFVAYMTYILLDASGHNALGAYSAVMWSFVLPLTFVTLFISGFRAWRDTKKVF